MTSATPASIPSTRWTEITAIWRDNRWLFALSGWLLGVLTIVALQRLNTDAVSLLHDLVPEAVGIVFTVLILERFAANRAIHERKLILFRQAKIRSNDVALEAVDQIVHQDWWNELLEHYRDKEGRVNLNAVYWSGGIQLPGVNLENADLRAAHLENANLRDANLENADLRAARLEDVNLYKAHLENANLRDANLENAYLGFAHLENANLRDANLENAYLSGANLENANLLHAQLKKANLGFAQLKNADLSGANLENANLRAAHLENADLEDAHLENTDLDSAHLENAHLVLAHLENANLRAVHLENANLSSAHLENAKLLFAHLENVFLVATHLENADLYKAHLENALLFGASLRGAQQIETAFFNEKTVLPDAGVVGLDANHQPIFGKFWTPDTDMTRYTNPDHPDFWESELAKYAPKQQENKSG